MNPFLVTFLCIRDQHRPELVALAALVCLFTACTTVILLQQARRARGEHRRNWSLVAGIAIGFGSWATHFIALLGYASGFATGYQLELTVFSLLVGLCISMIAMLVITHTRGAVGRMAGSLLLGTGIAVMHYTGMSALSIPAQMHWNPVLVAASLVLPVLLLRPALTLAINGRRREAVAGVGLMTLSILVLHFTGMSALSLTPARGVPRGIIVSPGTLAGWLGAVSLGIFALGITLQLMRHYTRSMLEAHERDFAVLVRTISDCAICKLDRNGRMAQWNAGVKALIGYEAEDVIGMPFARFFTQQDRIDGLPAATLATARAQGSCSGNWLCQRRDGSTFWAHGTVEKLSDAEGRALGFSLVIRDVTLSKQAQDLVAAASQRLDTALENMHEGLCLFDAQERVVLCNRRFRELWDLTEASCTSETPLGSLVVSGFMNPDHSANPVRQLWEFRQILEDALGEEHPAPVIAEFGENRVISIANSLLPDGGWVTTCTDITDQRRSEARIEHMALHDALTGLPNRTRFYLQLDLKLERAVADGVKLAVIALDLDRFKEINDTHGHAAGDLVLQVIARRFEAALIEDEAVSRLGGDEFAAAKIFSEASELEDFIARIRGCILAPIEDGDRKLAVGASLGVAVHPGDGNTRETLLSNADLAMYRAKSTVGEKVCYFEPGMDEMARARRQLANDLRQAIAHDELTVLYQPQRALRTGTLAGYEALLRWRHPKRGMVPPDEFIPIAEETGEIIPIGAWVLRQACLEARHWPKHLKVAVNLSAVQFLQLTLVETVRQILIETGLPPHRLELEITETAIITDKLRALHCLRQIKAMGVSVAIDDFGTGYSSLDTLHSFPFDKIKIDKSFLSKAEISVQARAIIRAVLALGKSLDIPVLAEGVETESQLRVLESEGCDEAQGYYLGIPAAAPSLDGQQAAIA